MFFSEHSVLWHLVCQSNEVYLYHAPEFPPSPLLAVPNVTAHPSTASVPTSYYRCGTITASDFKRIKVFKNKPTNVHSTLKIYYSQTHHCSNPFARGECRLRSDLDTTCFNRNFTAAGGAAPRSATVDCGIAGRLIQCSTIVVVAALRWLQLVLSPFCSS